MDEHSEAVNPKVGGVALAVFVVAFIAAAFLSGRVPVGSSFGGIFEPRKRTLTAEEKIAMLQGLAQSMARVESLPLEEKYDVMRQLEDSSAPSLLTDEQKLSTLRRLGAE